MGGRWAAEDGAIRGTNTSSEPRDGFLVAGETARDFALRLKFRDRKGGGGLVVRAEGAGAGGLKGLRAEIDPAGDVGGLHDAEGGTWLARPKPEDVKKALKPDGWNELSVVALGDRVAVLLNGQKTAEAVVPEPRESGRIALQLRGGQDVDLEFRDIDILPIDREARRAPPR